MIKKRNAYYVGLVQKHENEIAYSLVFEISDSAGGGSFLMKKGRKRVLGPDQNNEPDLPGIGSAARFILEIQKWYRHSRNEGGQREQWPTIIIL